MREVDLGRVAHPRLAVNAVLNLESAAVLVGRDCSVGRKRSAVIDLLFVLGDPVDAIDVNLAARDGELAVMDDELDVREVVADVGELAGIEAHVIRANSSTLGHGRTRELDIGLGVGGVVRGDGIAGHHLLSAVVSRSCGVAGDGDGDLVGDGRHLEGARGRNKPVIAVLGVRIESIGKGVLNFARVGDGGRVRERCALAFGKAGNRLHFMLGVRCTVVGPLARSRSQGNLSLVDDELAVLGLHHELVGYIIAVGILHNGSTDDVVGVLADVGLARVLGRKAGNGVCDAVDFEGICLDTGGLMNFTVVSDGSGVRLDGDLVLGIAIPDRQDTLDLVDNVVIGLRAFIQHIGEGVERLTHGSLGTQEGVRGTFALSPTSLGLECSLPINKRGSIILLVKIGRLKGDSCLPDAHITICHIKENVCEVCGVAVGEFTLEAHIRHAKIGAYRLGGAGEHNLILGIELVVRREGVSGSREFLAVISTLGFVANNGDLNGGLNRIDDELTYDLFDSVVVGFRAFFQRIGKVIVRATCIELRARYLIHCALTQDKAVATCNNNVIG